MRKFVILLAINLQRLNNAEYLNLMNRLEELIEIATPAGVGLTDEEKAEFSKLVNSLRKRINISSASALTELLSELEKQRDSMLTYLFAAISYGMGLPMTTIRDAAKALELTIRPYKGAQSLPNQQETIFVNSLLRDLDTESAKENISVMNLTELISELESINTRYAELIQRRAEEMEEKNMSLISTQVTREKLDDVFSAIQLITQAKNIVDPTDASAAFIQNFNAVIREVKRLNNIRTGGAKGDKEETVIPETKPEEGTDVPFEPVDPNPEEGGGEEETPSVV